MDKLTNEGKKCNVGSLSTHLSSILHCKKRVGLPDSKKNIFKKNYYCVSDLNIIGKLLSQEKFISKFLGSVRICFKVYYNNQNLASLQKISIHM